MNLYDFAPVITLTESFGFDQGPDLFGVRRIFGRRYSNKRLYHGQVIRPAVFFEPGLLLLMLVHAVEKLQLSISSASEVVRLVRVSTDGVLMNRLIDSARVNR